MTGGDIAVTASVLAVIPARYASTRFPGKPLAPIAGKPMVQHVYERVRQARLVSRVIVATDDARIVEAVEKFGGEALLTGDHATGTDRIAEAARLVADSGDKYDWVLNVQGDEPLIDPLDLDRLIQGMAGTPDAVMGTMVFPIQESDRDDEQQGKVVLDAQNRALYFSRAAIPFLRTPGYQGWRTMGLYLFRGDFLHTFAALPPTPLSQAEQLEQLRALEHGYPIHCFEAGSASEDVDQPGDIAKVEQMLRDGR